MQRSLQQHQEILRAIQSSIHPDAQPLATDYEAWVNFGFQLAWPDERRLSEQQGIRLVERAKAVLGKDLVEQILTTKQ
jgi:hypothetical protein